ncbi:MAG: hypothetical protein ABR567_08660 [Myxococcales bacterium]
MNPKKTDRGRSAGDRDLTNDTNQTKQLYSFGGNEPLVAALADAEVPFLVVGGLAVQFHVPERVPDDLDLVIAPTLDAGRRLLRALVTIGTPGLFTPEEWEQHPRPAGFPLKKQFYADIFRAPPWFNFEEQWNAAHDARLFNTPVKVASKAALVAWIEHAPNPKPKHLHDLELLRAT